MGPIDYGQLARLLMQRALLTGGKKSGFDPFIPTVPMPYKGMGAGESGLKPQPKTQATIDAFEALKKAIAEGKIK